MVLSRATALRAASIARYARSARCIRSAELQPWQRTLQRRTYASEHGAHGEQKKSDIPWMIGSAAGTSVALYVVLTQDTSHGHHEENHALQNVIDHDQTANETPEAKKGDKNFKQTDDRNAEKGNDQNNDESQDDDKDEGKDENKDEKEESKDEDKDDSKDQGEDDSKPLGDKKKSGEKPNPPADPSNPDSTRPVFSNEQSDGKGSMEEGMQQQDEPSAADPAKSDKSGPRKEAKSQNEMSGKQAGLSNDDTHHTYKHGEDPNKSKKGEGVVDTAKLKGTVSVDRPAAENKEERGKSVSDKK